MNWAFLLFCGILSRVNMRFLFISISCVLSLRQVRYLLSLGIFVVFLLNLAIQCDVQLFKQLFFPLGCHSLKFKF